MFVRPYIPNQQTLDQLHASFALHVHSYPDIGASKGDFPSGYDHDSNSIFLGQGEKVFKKARKAIVNWHMFPSSWTKVYPSPAPIKEGTEVVVLFRLFGLWWANPCRIIYVVDEKNRFGFAYGTLVGHVEKGEEYFGVYLDAKGQVRYEIKAFSKPAFWLARLTYPLPRFFQRQFVKASMDGMKASF